MGEVPQQGENPFHIDEKNKAFVSDEKSHLREYKDLPYAERLYQNNRRADKYGLIDKLMQDAEEIAYDRDRILLREMASLGTQDLKVGMNRHGFNPEFLPSSETQKTLLQNKPFVKDKRESMHEFITKKRELFLANMNINTKKEETKIIKETLVNKEEGLSSQQANYAADKQSFERWLKSLKEEAEARRDEAQAKAEEKANVEKEIANLTNEIQRYESTKMNGIAELNIYKEYKRFIDEISRERKIALPPPKPQSSDRDSNNVSDSKRSKTIESHEKPGDTRGTSFFPTQPRIEGESRGKMRLKQVAKNLPDRLKEGTLSDSQRRNQFIEKHDENFAIPFSAPGELLKLLSKMEEDNLSLIQNTQTSEEEYERLSRKYKSEEADYERKCANLRDQKEELEVKRAALLEELEKIEEFRDPKKFSGTKTKTGNARDSKKIKYEEVTNKISEICRGAVIELSRPDDTSSMETIAKLKFIENLMDELFKKKKDILKNKDKDWLEDEEDKLLKIKKNQKMKEAKERDEMLKEEQRRRQREKLENQSFRIRSRKIMSRAPPIKKNKVEVKQEVREQEEDISKYFKE